MSGSGNTVRFEKYRRLDKDTKERAVNYNGSPYIFLLQPANAGRVKVLKNPKDSVIATVFLDGANRLGILLGDGRVLKWNKTSTMSASYQLDGKDVMNYKFKRAGKEATVTFTDSTIPVDALQIICLERGADIFDSNSIGPAIGVGIALALVRVIAGSQ